MMYLTRALFFAFICTLLFSCGQENSETEVKPTRLEKENLEKASLDPEPQPSTFDMQYFQGMIDGKYEIMMRLKNNKGQVTGKYFYLNHKKPIDIKGELNNGVLQMNEFFENKSTGSWKSQAFSHSEFIGEWSGNNKTFPFKLNSIEEAVYREALNMEPKKYNVKQFKDLLTLFELKAVPFKLTANSEEGTLDTLSYQKYFDPEFIFDDGFGYNDVFPGIRFETNFGHLLVVYRYFTPGAFGINNTFITLYTFDKLGNLISSEEVGCHCFDSNLGANDYYSNDAELEFFENYVLVNSKDVHATLFTEELEEGEDEIWEETIIESRFNFLPDGQIEEYKLEREHPE